MHRFFLIVRDVNGGDAEFLLEPDQLFLHLAPETEIERSQRLVQKQHRGLHGNRPCERDPLALAPAELVNGALAETFEPHHAQCLVHPALALGLAHLAHFQAETDIGFDGHVGKQCVVLKHGHGRPP